MTALVITAANVIPAANATKVTGVAGGTVTRGQPVYRSSSTRKFLAADSNDASAEVRTVFGIALTDSALNQPIVVQTAGDLNPGAAVTVGEIYCLGDVAGGIIPKADLSAGEYVSILGVATTTSNIRMGIQNSGVAG